MVKKKGKTKASAKPVVKAKDVKVQPVASAPEPHRSEAESRPMGITNPEEARSVVSDIKVVGDPDFMSVLSKASSETQGWMKSTKAREVPGLGVLVQFTNRERNPDGSVSLTDSGVWIPGAFIQETKDGHKTISKIGS